MRRRIPCVCFNAETQKWIMYYTARRATAANAPGVQWVHGSNIGMAESSDGGATWIYKGTADISYGKDQHPDDYTYWAPEVIWANGTYHMFLSYVPGIFNDWNHPRANRPPDEQGWRQVGHRRPDRPEERPGDRRVRDPTARRRMADVVQG